MGNNCKTFVHLRRWVFLGLQLAIWVNSFIFLTASPDENASFWLTSWLAALFGLIIWILCYLFKDPAWARSGIAVIVLHILFVLTLSVR